MRLLHRFYDLYSGGAEVVLLNIARSFPDDRHALVFNRRYETWIARELEQLSNVDLLQTADPTLEHELANCQPDLLLYHYYPPMAATDFVQLSPQNLAKTIFFNHWHTAVPYLRGLRRYWFVSPYSQRTAGFHVPADQADVIINPVMDRYFDVRRTTDRPFTVGRHSRDSSIKFSPDFFQIFEQCSIDNLSVDVLGAHQALLETHEQHAQQLRHRYHLRPFNSMDVADFLSQIDVYVYKTSASFQETCPNNILEALAAGIPVVAERKGGIVDLVQDGETGFLCDSAEDYRIAVERLHNDPALRLAMGQQAREWALASASSATYRANFNRLLTDLGFDR